MIGSLARSETDMTSSEMSMASDRLQVVEFTMAVTALGYNFFTLLHKTSVLIKVVCIL